MIKIMFVCHGNICRSPMAEFIMKKITEDAGLQDEFYIKSSATSTEEIWNGKGNPVYPPAKAELKNMVYHRMENTQFSLKRMIMKNMICLSEWIQQISEI